MPPELQTLNVILQGGSFALVAWAVVYAIRTLAPQVVDAHEKSQVKFDNILERQERRHDVAFEKVTSSLKEVAATLVSVVSALSDVTDRLERVEAKTDDLRTPLRRRPAAEPEGLRQSDEDH